MNGVTLPKPELIGEPLPGRRVSVFRCEVVHFKYGPFPGIILHYIPGPGTAPSNHLQIQRGFAIQFKFLRAETRRMFVGPAIRIHTGRQNCLHYLIGSLDTYPDRSGRQGF